MIKILLITDEYLRKNFPIPARMNSSQIEGFIKAAQLTHLTSFTGYCLYEHIEDKVVAQTLTTEEVVLYQMMQYLTAMYTYQLCNEFLKSEIANTKNEETSSSRSSLDDRIYAMDSQINSIESRFRRTIENVNDDNYKALLEIATAYNCGYEIDDNFNKSDIYYPYGGSDDCDECTDGGIHYVV
tara:strand:- start:592 stop:1143 length:552 start_codon:yes stop_codon:yes gene_type:complete